MNQQRRCWLAAAALSLATAPLAAGRVLRQEPRSLIAKPPDSSRVTCENATSCAHCSLLPECGWCGETQKCVGGNQLGPFNTQCRFYDFSHCTHIPCEARASCSDCITDGECGWCGADASCTGGRQSGPFDPSLCPLVLWVHSKSKDTCFPGPAPTLQPPSLWGKLRGMMYRSDALHDEVQTIKDLRANTKNLRTEVARWKNVSDTSGSTIVSQQAEINGLEAENQKLRDQVAKMVAVESTRTPCTTPKPPTTTPCPTPPKTTAPPPPPSTTPPPKTTTPPPKSTTLPPPKTTTPPPPKSTTPPPPKTTTPPPAAAPAPAPAVEPPVSTSPLPPTSPPRRGNLTNQTNLTNGSGLEPFGEGLPPLAGDHWHNVSMEPANLSNQTGNAWDPLYEGPPPLPPINVSLPNATTNMTNQTAKS